MAEANDLDLELLPADDDELDEVADLDLAEASALEGVPPVEANDPVEPLGKTWKFDYDQQRFVRQGSSPVEVRGVLCLQEWVQLAIRTARFAHDVFSEDYGMESPEDVIGQVPPDELLADYGNRMREAVLVHDRVTDFTDFQGDYDPSEGTINISFAIETDDELRIVFEDVQLSTANLS